MPQEVVFKALGFGLIWLLFLLVLVVLLLSLAKKFVNHFNDRGAYLSNISTLPCNAFRCVLFSHNIACRLFEFGIGVVTVLVGAATGRYMADQETLNRRRVQFQELYDSIIACQKQFFAWFEEAKTTELKTEEIYQVIEEILIDEQHYRRLVNDLPNVETFTTEQLENRIGEVSRLFEIGEEIIRLGTVLEMKVTKLRYLLDGNQLQ